MNRLVLFVFVLFTISAAARPLPLLEDSLVTYYGELAKSKNDSLSESLSSKIRNLLVESFDEDGVFDFPFNRLKFSKLQSEDGLVRIFNWNQPFQDGSFKYYCLLLRKHPKKQTVEWFELKDYQKEVDKIENKILNADKWLGALYYEIISVDSKKNDTYIVLGWDGKDDMTTCKIVDVIEFSGSKVRLGAAIFPGAMGNQKRLIFEYSNEVSMSVKYYPKKKCIVVDHLAPKSSMMTGVYADYGPDGSYDLYQYEKNKWILYENIDISEFAKSDDRPFVDPRAPQRRRR
jgi:hypothetical protein